MSTEDIREEFQNAQDPNCPKCKTRIALYDYYPLDTGGTCIDNVIEGQAKCLNCGEIFPIVGDIKWRIK